MNTFDIIQDPYKPPVGLVAIAAGNGEGIPEAGAPNCLRALLRLPCSQTQLDCALSRATKQEKYGKPRSEVIKQLKDKGANLNGGGEGGRANTQSRGSFLSQVVRDESWTCAGIACFNVIEGVPHALMCQEADSAGYWKIFGLDLSSRADCRHQNFSENVKKRVREMDSERLQVMSSWSFEDLGKFTKVYLDVSDELAKLSGCDVPVWHDVLAKMDQAQPFDFGTLSVSKRIDGQLWDRFVEKAIDQLKWRENDPNHVTPLRSPITSINKHQQASTSINKHQQATSNKQ